MPTHTYPLDANPAGAQISADSFSSPGRPTYPAEVPLRSHPGFGRQLKEINGGNSRKIGCSVTIVVLLATTPVIRRRSISVVDNCFRMENFSHSCRSDMSRLNPLMRSPTSGLITRGNCVWLIPPSLNICCVSIRTGAPASIVDSMVVEEPPWWFCRPTQ